MPTIYTPDQLPKSSEKNGWVETRLADAATFDHAAMVARRWSLKPGGQTPEFKHNGNERFLYVISGSGTAHVNGEGLELDHEAVLWLESGDRYAVEAGPTGLEILLAYAPGD